MRKVAVIVAGMTLVGGLAMAGAGRFAGSADSRAVARAHGMGRTPRPAALRNIDCAKVKCIALTFDDGPVPDTARLLRILQQHGVRATFFLVGQNVTEFPDMVRRELADGHELGDHTWSHANLVTLSTPGVRSQIARTQAAVQKAAGVTPQVFRPPYGNTNARVAGIVRQFGLPQFLWDLDPLDWRDRDSAAVERRVVKGAEPGGIVLMHDIHPTTITAVPHILDRLAAKGFVFVTVSELFGGKLNPGAEYSRLNPPPAVQPGTATPAPGGTPPSGTQGG